MLDILTLSLCVLVIFELVYVSELRRCGRAAIRAVAFFAGFMDGMACGPAEREMVERCLPLAKMLGADR